MRKINQYKRTYYKEYSALVTFLFVTFLLLTPIEQQTYTRVEQPTTQATTTQETIEEKIIKHFPRSHKTVLAIAKAESNLDMNAKGFNCYYNNDKTIVYTSKIKGSHSTHCKKSHRQYAWSVDCFILQRNYKGQECPQNITIDQHLEDVANLSRVQGLKAWSAYNNNQYKKHLSTN